MNSTRPADGAPQQENTRGIATSFDSPEWYLRKFAANIRVRSETVTDLTQGLFFDRVLDIGCGDGSLSIPLLPRLKEITFLDPSAAMLERVSKQIIGRDKTTARFVNSGFMEADMPDASYDLIICVGVLAYVQSLSPFISKIQSILKPGGRLLLECTNAAHPLSHLERAYQSATGFIKRKQFVTYSHSEQDVMRVAIEHGLRGLETFKYSYSIPLIAKLVSQKQRYHIIRSVFGSVKRNRRARMGNQCLFYFERSNVGRASL